MDHSFDLMNKLGRKIFLPSITLNYFIRILVLPNIKIMKKILSPSKKKKNVLFNFFKCVLTLPKNDSLPCSRKDYFHSI